MSHMTADLEYFKCDMCGVYMHRDIYCDHRRDCHGRDSTVLKRGECAVLSAALSRDTRELLLAKESEAAAGRPATHSSSSSNHSSAAGCAEAGASPSLRDSDKDVVEAEGKEKDEMKDTEKATTAAQVPSRAAGRSGSTAISASVSAAELERRQEARTRRAVSDRYQATLDAKIGALLTEEKRTALMSFLNS